MTRTTTCARLADRSVWCWGARGKTLVEGNAFGDLACPVATRVDELSDVESLHGTCVVRPGGVIRCANLHDWTFTDTPGYDPNQIVGHRDGLCVTTRAGRVRCTPPIQSGLDDVYAAEQLVFAPYPCWLTLGTFTCREGGVDVTLVDKVTSYALGPRGLLVVRKDGTFGEWGLCPNETPPRVCAEAVPGAPKHVMGVAHRGEQTCVTLAGGAVHCTTVKRSPNGAERVFSRVDGVVRAYRIETAEHHACALVGNGDVVCWGNSKCGQAGGNAPADQPCKEGIELPPTTVQWAK